MFWFVPFSQTMDKQHRTYLWLNSSLRHALPPRFLPKPSLILLFCLTARQLGLFCFPGTLFTRVAFRAAFDSYAIFFGFTFDFFFTDAVLSSRAEDEAGRSSAPR